MSKRDVGWFADLDNGDEPRRDGWQPCLETGEGIVPSFDMWFASEADCLDFIRDVIIPAAGKIWGDA